MDRGRGEPDDGAVPHSLGPMHVPRSRLVPAVAAVVLSLALAACGTSGRTLRDPKEGAKAPARANTGATTTTVAGGASSTGPVLRGTGLAITTTAWPARGTIPKAYTCDGADTSPPLTISGVPAGAVELVLVVTSQSRPDQSLWLLSGIGPATTSIPQGGVPSGAVQIVNSSGTGRWKGPCPTAGTEVVEFALYALAAPSGLTSTSTFAQVEAAIAAPMSAAVVTGSYTRS